MPNSKPFPSKESDLNNYFTLVVAYLIVAANKTRLMVSDANATLLSTRLAAWTAAYGLTTNVNTHTKTATDNKDIAKAELMTLLRSIYADIPNSALTAADRNILNLSEPGKTRTKARTPDTKPIAQADTSNRLMHQVSFTDEDGSAAKPEGARGCEIWMRIGTVALDEADLKYAGTATDSPFEIWTSYF